MTLFILSASLLVVHESTPKSSPLEPVFANHAVIPFPFSEQFLHSEDLPYGVRLEGTMLRIWHRPAILHSFFWALGKAGILIPQNAENVPTSLVVRHGNNVCDGVYHIWDRTFKFKKPVRFRTTIIFDPTINKVVDLVGPRNVLYMAWNAKFQPPDKFTLDTHSCAIRIRNRKFWMPRWLWNLLLGKVTFSQTADATKTDVVYVDLLITHPIFGKIFGYEGSFRVVRTKRQVIMFGE